MARKTLIQLRRDTAANWTSANPTLAAGEAGWETDTKKIKIGDGSTAWNSLAYTNFGISGDVATDAIWDTKGDLAVATGANAAVKLPAGVDGKVLVTDSAQTTGLRWGDGSTGPTPFGLFGTGQDGNVTLTATDAAPDWATKPLSNVFRLDRDIYCINLTLDDVNGAFSIRCNGYRIFCTGTLTIDAGVTVGNLGNAASSTTAGVITNAGTLGTGVAGRNGASGSSTATQAGAASGSIATMSGTQVEGGGAGGAVSGGPGTGGGTNGGNVVNNADNGTPGNIVQAVSPVLMGSTTRFTGGGGGTAGNSVVSSSSGAGGGGGGIIVIAAKTIVNNGSITVKGGAGSAAAGSGTGAGGGGGGGGGAAILIYVSSGTTIGSVDVTGGAGGAAQGAGKDGATGHSGLVWTHAL